MTVREAVCKIKSLRAERLSEISGTYMFFIAGVEPSKFAVEILDGRLEVYEEDKPSDCSISTDLETFEGIVGGAVNPFAAFMSGKLKISGDLTFAMKLNKLLGGE